MGDPYLDAIFLEHVPTVESFSNVQINNLDTADPPKHSSLPIDIETSFVAHTSTSLFVRNCEEEIS
jgi:hypothetical protein